MRENVETREKPPYRNPTPEKKRLFRRETYFFFQTATTHATPQFFLFFPFPGARLGPSLVFSPQKFTGLAFFRQKKLIRGEPP